MVTCKTCGVDICKDGRRKYCDRCRQFVGGEWRRKYYIRDFFRENKRKYDQRMTRKVSTGFSEHLICDKKTGKALFDRERTAVIREKKRILNSKKVNNLL